MVSLPCLTSPPDADDEAMMELAIALSLQEQSNQDGGGLNLQGLGLAGHHQGQSSSSLEAGTLSDTTASGKNRPVWKRIPIFVQTGILTSA